MSDVYVSFLNLPLQFETEAAGLLLTEIEYIKELIKSRFQYIYGDAHGVGYLLDPRYTGEKLEPKLREELEEFIVNFPLDKEIPSQENKIATYRQLMEFFISANGHKARNSFHYKMLVQEQKSPLEYWLIYGTNWPLLQKIDKKVFSMAVSSTSSERNFSTFGFVHSKLRNQLAPETVKK